MHEKDTDELFSELKEDEDIHRFLTRNKKEFRLPLHEYLGQILKEKKLERHQVVKDSFQEQRRTHREPSCFPLLLQCILTCPKRKNCFVMPDWECYIRGIHGIPSSYRRYRKVFL